MVPKPIPIAAEVGSISWVELASGLTVTKELVILTETSKLYGLKRTSHWTLSRTLYGPVPVAIANMCFGG
jgi:hypothetical protein